MINREEILRRLKGGLIVSCQSEPELGSQLHEPNDIARMAKEVLDAGACAVRICGAYNVRATRQLNPDAIIIGIAKDKYPDGLVLITPNLAAVGYLVEAGADIVGLDMTKRPRPDGTSAYDLAREIRIRPAFSDVLLMADIADAAEARASVVHGVDLVATTLSGYTPDTKHRLEPHPWYDNGPDEDLVLQLTDEIRHVPIIAEGRWRDPEQCRSAIHTLGAYAVCVGSQITRPRMQVKWHLEAIKPPIKEEP